MPAAAAVAVLVLAGQVVTAAVEPAEEAVQTVLLVQLTQVVVLGQGGLHSTQQQLAAQAS
jgi:hypothetical protein